MNTHFCHEETPTDRIGRALDTLKAELVELQAQDVAILKQLLHVHHTIKVLSGRRDPHRRSYSSSSITPKEEEESDPEEEPLQKSVSGHALLCRHQSAPLQDLNDGEIEYEIEEEEEGWLSQSLNCSRTQMTDDMLRELTDVLAPLPVAFRRKRCTIDPTQILKDYIWCEEPRRHGDDDVKDTSPNELSYKTLLRCSAAAWKDVQREREENGAVGERKMATLKLFL